ncbi:undecaprenyl-phosphate glucose phosphotransferase [Aureivirga sp. CE67]|uniref:undecaprenyl-phosphate glucose phosphotransferase n=1 Tax=Aureivirga sp. CE67 TaxID=1788983 RepID=UPI001E343F9E|nr:undecaprenyl-phosphate glucose phosphotransferase [Aureivirga sp. CE67]
MNKRYSIFIIPILIISHLFILNGIFYFLIKNNYWNLESILVYNIGWLYTSLIFNTYRIRRYSKLSIIMFNFLKHAFVFSFLFFAYFGVTNKFIDVDRNINVLLLTFSIQFIFSYLYIFALKKYRIEGGNIRKVVIIGENQSVDLLRNFFNKNAEYGYKYQGFFSETNKECRNKYLGKVEDCFDYVLDNKIDEIYCSISSLSTKMAEKIVDFGDNNLVLVKFVPDATKMLHKTVLEYYDYIPILSRRILPFDNSFNKGLKRLFDILFSLGVIVFVLSWLIPIFAILIKLESKGKVFFKQTRDGLNGSTFECYKFRSMKVNNDSDKKQATRGDARITKIGSFMRKTSIDELPQFFNVLKGDMSIVGPRPHMVRQTKEYSKTVNKYMVRHFVKPGITGLAQVKGYRGEIETKHDIDNRVRLDIFYIENWSFLLDLKIILLTVTNAIEGEDKAY